ncbi:hypothetical protein ACJMK2_020653 [Sinanodonta woodiana]|uniref:Uncharacterized protein n=1 Tax=Sinanodonta woodiana TaxID=1069815 RepID=A0ABD3U224_SINWO
MFMRGRSELEDAWNEENGFTSFLPTMTIGSAFRTPSHGPTPPLPPPPTNEIHHSFYVDETTDSDSIDPPQSPIQPHFKTFPCISRRVCPNYIANEFSIDNDMEPLYHTQDYHLGNTDRLCQSGLTDAWCRQRSQHTDDYRHYSLGKITDRHYSLGKITDGHYSLGKITDAQSLTSEENINDNNRIIINEILENAEAIQVTHETTSTENVYQELVSEKEDDTMPKNPNPCLDGDNACYIDMTAKPTFPDEEVNVHMKITLNRSAAVEICRKATLRGISCTSELMYGHVINTPPKFSVDEGVAEDNYAHIDTCYPVYIEITE